MKKSIFVLALALCVTTVLWGQQPRQEVEALRAAIFTQALDLSPEESQGFWPLFNEYEEKRKDLRRQYRADRRLELMTDEEAETFMEETFEREEKELELKKEYFRKFKSVLPVRKIARLPAAEKAFQQRLLEILKTRRQNRRNN